MIIGSKMLKDRCEKGLITPFDPLAIQPNSIDVRLGNEFLFIDAGAQSILTLDEPVIYTKRNATRKKPVILMPGEFCLATTIEAVAVPIDLCCTLSGRSSVARIGLAVHITAGHVDTGFPGTITLELYNHSPLPIQLPVGRRIGQLIFNKTTEVLRPYHGKYTGQKTATGSRAHQDFEVCSYVA